MRSGSQYDDFFLVMNCFVCSIKSGDLSLRDHLAYRWIDSDAGVDWVEADVKVFEEYKKSKVSPRI